MQDCTEEKRRASIILLHCQQYAKYMQAVYLHSKQQLGKRPRCNNCAHWDRIRKSELPWIINGIPKQLSTFQFSQYKHMTSILEYELN